MSVYITARASNQQGLPQYTTCSQKLTQKPLSLPHPTESNHREKIHEAIPNYTKFNAFTVDRNVSKVVTF